jgi:hypothetical protein
VSVRVAASGSQGTGKSTLIASFLERRPGYASEPEAFETLADDIDVTPGKGPSVEGLRALLEFTLGAVSAYAPGACVIHERSPVDYLAYAVARGGGRTGSRARFLATHVPLVRDALRYLDLIVLLPVSASGPIEAREGDDVRFRKRVDEALRRALLDDDHDLFGAGDSPRVVELAPRPERQLLELLRLTEPG